MYLLTHSVSPVLVLVAVMDPKVLKTKISHTHSLIHSLLYCPNPRVTQANIEGSMRLKLRVSIGRDLADEENETIIRSLGTIATSLHFPPEAFLPDIYLRNEAAIIEAGDINLWATKSVIKV